MLTSIAFMLRHEDDMVAATRFEEVSSVIDVAQYATTTPSAAVPCCQKEVIMYTTTTTVPKYLSNLCMGFAESGNRHILSPFIHSLQPATLAARQAFIHLDGNIATATYKTFWTLIGTSHLQSTFSQASLFLLWILSIFGR